MAEGNPLASLTGNVGSEAELRYAEDFTSAALDVRLLEVDEDLLQEILHTGVTIKGGDTQPAVLCTQRSTYALVELPFSSNSLVLVPPSGVEAASNGHGMTVTGACPATGHLELTEVAPPLSALRAVLRARPYSEACEGDAAARRSAGYTWEELCEAVHCSSAQLLDGLAQHRALCLEGRWVVLDAGYTRRCLDLLVMNAGIQGWSLDSMPLEEAVDTLVGDGIEAPVARHVITMFASTAAGGADGAVALDARAVCAEKACALLEERAVWRLTDFQAAWSKACPPEMPPHLDMLRGLALVEPQGADHTVTAFLAVDLPPKPKERFARLFARKERWSRAELEPYLAYVEEAKASVEGLLLAWCRRSQGSAGEAEVFTQRHAG